MHHSQRPAAFAARRFGKRQRAHVRDEARALWAGFRRHPWLAPALSLTRPQILPNALEVRLEYEREESEAKGVDLKQLTPRELFEMLHEDSIH